MSDNEPRGCVLCPDPERRRLPHRPPVCEACRSWLAGMAGDIRILAEQLVTPEPAVQDLRVAPMLEPGWVAGRAVRDRRVARDEQGNLKLRWRDPLGRVTPVGPIRGQYAGPRVASVPDSHPPIPLEPVDLVMPANPASRALFARAALGLDEEQVGSLSVATVLEGWVRELIQARGRGEHRPPATVDGLTRWLADRLDWACDEFDLVGDFAEDLRVYRSALRRALGLSDRPDYMTGVPCRNCDVRALYRRNGSTWVECGNCPNLLSPDEYTDWVQRALGESPSAVDAAQRNAE